MATLVDEWQRTNEGQGMVYVNKTLDRDVAIPAGCVWLQHDITINNGVNLTISDTAELLLL